MSGAFDGDAFIRRAQSFQSSMSTAPLAVPADDYTLIVKDLKARQNNDGSTVLDVVMQVDDAHLAERMGRKEVTTRYSCWLDFTPAGDLDDAKGKNAQLGALREALDQNGPGDWSPQMLIGGVVRGTVTVKNDKDGVERDRVSKVWKRDA